ncbi:unnamed protein product, partial [marine sediment metagenome]
MDPIKAMQAIMAPKLRVPTSPGKILAGYLLYKKKGIKTAIKGKVRRITSAEFHSNPQIKIKHNAIKQVPLLLFFLLDCLLLDMSNNLFYFYYYLNSKYY